MAKREANAVHREVAVLFLLAVALAVPALLLARGRAAAAPAPAPTGPAAPKADDASFMPLEGGSWAVSIDSAEAERLMGLFFDTLVALSAGKDLPEAGAAKGAAAPVFVTVYGRGGARFRAPVRAGDPGLSVREAAAGFFRQTGGQAAPEALRVRVDVVRSVRPFPAAERVAFAERGLCAPLGLAVQGSSGLSYFLPADTVDFRAENNAEVLSNLCRQAGLGVQDWRKDDVAVWALDVVGFMNDAGGSRRVLPSARGLASSVLVNMATLRRAARSAGDYMDAARAEDDSFLMFWNPLSDLRGGCESLTEQASAAAALAELGGMLGGDKYLATSHEAISFTMRYTDMDPHDPGMAFTTRDEVCQELLQTEASARVLESLCRFRSASRFEEPLPWIRAMAQFLVFMQRTDGRFDLKYDAASHSKITPLNLADAVTPQATAALALALASRELGQPALMQAAQKALDGIAQAAKPAERHWTAEEACALLEAVAEVNRSAPQDRNLKLADEVAACRRKAQLDEGSAPAPDLAGASLSTWPPTAGATAQDLNAFASACLLGEEQRRQNLTAAEGAAGYLLGLQFLPENSYYLPDPNAGSGGFREQPGSNLVRLQTVETALRGLTKLNQVKLSDNDGKS